MNTSAAQETSRQPSPTTLILGTAGHIDHGKSTLVKNLTGIDPDRLPEEKQRGMTIELGFARLDLPRESDDESPLRFGIVDVPGHERFVRTMVAGAAGIDIAMLVIAADDGWMPQTQEHFDILTLLRVNRGLVAITKCDLVAPERISDVEADIRERLRKTPAADWPIVQTAAAKGAGIDELKHRLAELASNAARPAANHLFRMHIDRVFTIHGRGTVVTGSVVSGTVQVDDELELLPAGQVCRVRGIQNHGEDCNSAGVGARAALNLTQVERSAVDRGMDLATPGYLTASRYIDIHLNLLPHLKKNVPSHRKVRVLTGTREVMATLVLFGISELDPGATGFAQLRLYEPIAAAFDQRVIVRDETAEHTLGGATVIRPVSTRLQSMRPDVLAHVEAAASTDASGRLADVYRAAGFQPLNDRQLSARIGIDKAAIATLREELIADGTLVHVAEVLTHRDVLVQLRDRAVTRVARHHDAHPREPGLSRDKLVGWFTARTDRKLAKPLLQHFISAGDLKENGTFITTADFGPQLSPEDEAALRKIVIEIELAGYDPPKWEKLNATAGLSRARLKELFNLAKIDPRLQVLNADQLISTVALERVEAIVEKLGFGGQKFTLAQVRDATGKSRRIVQALLEYLDKTGTTRRVGDERQYTGK